MIHQRDGWQRYEEKADTIRIHNDILLCHLLGFKFTQHSLEQ
jgi:hypothetical protein